MTVAPCIALKGVVTCILEYTSLEVDRWQLSLG